MSIIEIIIKAAEKVIAKDDKEDMNEKEMFCARPKQFERFVYLRTFACSLTWHFFNS